MGVAPCKGDKAVVAVGGKAVAPVSTRPSGGAGARLERTKQHGKSVKIPCYILRIYSTVFFLVVFVYTNKNRGEFMNKTNDLHLRLSSEDLELIKQVAKQYDMTVSGFIISVIKPLCLKKKNEVIRNENK